MQTINSLLMPMKEKYATIMDSRRNPLLSLPLAQRFQTMLYLSIMWTTIFCAAFGSWYWYGELIPAHMLLAPGVALTSITFSNAARRGPVLAVARS